jgi:hypothetical protein
MAFFLEVMDAKQWAHFMSEFKGMKTDLSDMKTDVTNLKQTSQQPEKSSRHSNAAPLPAPSDRSDRSDRSTTRGFLMLLFHEIN